MNEVENIMQVYLETPLSALWVFCWVSFLQQRCFVGIFAHSFPLFNNKLSGGVPESFVNLKCLTVLGLSKNVGLSDLDAFRCMLLEEYGHKHNLKLHTARPCAVCPGRAPIDGSDDIENGSGRVPS